MAKKTTYELQLENYIKHLDVRINQSELSIKHSLDTMVTHKKSISIERECIKLARMKKRDAQKTLIGLRKDCKKSV